MFLNKLNITRILCLVITLNFLSVSFVHGKQVKIDSQVPTKEVRETVQKFINAEPESFLKQPETPLKSSQTKFNDIALSDYTVASVNGDAITLFDIATLTFAQERNMLSRVKSLKKQIEATKQIRGRALKILIERKLVIQDYHDNPFDIEEQYIESEVDRLAEMAKVTSRIELKKKMKKEKKTIKDIREQAKDNIIYQMMLSSYFYNEMNVTPKEIYEYYKANINKYKVPKSYNLDSLFLKNDTENLKGKVTKISNDLKNNNKEIFYSLVQIYSETTNNTNGGNLGWLEENKLRKEFIKAISSLKINEISKPIHLKEGIFFLRINDLKPEKTLAINEVYSLIKNEFDYKQRKAIFDKKIAELKNKSIIKYIY